jgi:serine/threonine protein phosphatase PrpC
MEDRNLILPAFSPSMAVFAVFDGHNGVQAAEFTRKRIESILQHSEADIWSDAENFFKKTMQEIDDKFCSIAASKRLYSGTTALIAVIVKAENGDRRLVVSNVGDSQAFMSVQGKGESLSICHKPEMEVNRITAAGGWLCEERDMTLEGEHITYWLNGEMSMSRAIGDVEYKRLRNVYCKSAGCDWEFPPGHSKSFNADLVVAEPDVHVNDLSAKDEFLVLASDGLWDVMDGQTAVKQIQSMLTQSYSVQSVAERLALKAMDLGSSDNVTVVIVTLWD